MTPFGAVRAVLAGDPLGRYVPSDERRVGGRGTRRRREVLGDRDEVKANPGELWQRHTITLGVLPGRRKRPSQANQAVGRSPPHELATPMQKDRNGRRARSTAAPTPEKTEGNGGDRVDRHWRCRLPAKHVPVASPTGAVGIELETPASYHGELGSRLRPEVQAPEEAWQHVRFPGMRREGGLVEGRGGGEGGGGGRFCPVIHFFDKHRLKKINHQSGSSTGRDDTDTPSKRTRGRQTPH